MTNSEGLSLDTARQSLFSSFSYEDNSSSQSSNRKFPASSPIRGVDRLSRFSDRQIRPNPVIRKREDEQTTRRRLFLKTVRDRADDRRFETRSIEAQAIRSWHEEHQQYLACKAREASGNDLEMDSYIDDAINAQQQQQLDCEDLPEIYMDDYPADLEYEAMMKDDENSGLMSEWDLDDDMLLDLIRAEEQKQGDTNMS
ncbi:hypothetical protein Cpir12675_002359 [Ceratocystis pirilliformis]|uniref:Uncharacterized protein n=1 Tax=Ceratocystis pirilliformis TaxID=259994 RepID=A0ABR3ZA17_9PEZI